MEWSAPRSSAGWWFLSGTPGTGKSRVARELPPPLFGVEVADLAQRAGGTRERDGSVRVDLPRLGRYLSTHRPDSPVLLVGHLSHRLPIRRGVVLRCHPKVLAHRLARRAPPRPGNGENVLAEALDVVSVGARRRTGTALEIDTTGATPAEVAARISAWVRGESVPPDRVDWLADPSVIPLLRASES